MTRPCPHCGQRVRTAYEGDGVSATFALVEVYADHGDCPGSYEPVESAPVAAPRVLAQPEPPPPRVPQPPPVPRAPRQRHRPNRPRSPKRDLPPPPSPAAVLALLREEPQTAAEIAELAGSVPSRTIPVLVALRDEGRAWAYYHKSATLWTSTALPRCPIGFPASLAIWPHLCRGAYTVDELAALTGISPMGVRNVVGRFLSSLSAVRLPDGRYTAHPVVLGST